MLRAFILVLLPLAVVPYGAADAWSEGVVLAAVFALAAARFRRARLDGPMLQPFLAFAALALVQGFFGTAADPAAAVWSAVKFAGVGVYLRLVADAFAGRLRMLVTAIVASGVFFASLGLARYFLQAFYPERFPAFFLDELTPGVGFGTFINQNHFAFLMLLALGPVLGIWRFARLPVERRAMLLAAAALIWTACVMTASRGAIVSSFVAIGVVMLVPTRRGERTAPKLASFAVVAAVLAAVVLIVGSDRVAQRFGHLPDQVEGETPAGTFRRIDVWDAALRVAARHPFVGAGFGGFRYVVSRDIDISGETVPEQAHDDYLELLAVGGIAGLGLGVWALRDFFRATRERLAAESSDRFARAARIGALAGIAGAAAHSLFDYGAQWFANTLFLTTLAAIACGGTHARRGRSALVPVALLVAAAASLAFGFYRYRLAHAAASPEDFARVPFRLPFDAAYFQIEALALRRAGDDAAAGDSLRRAIGLRPDDYRLRLAFADVEPSDANFVAAIERAPHYAAPRLAYGRWLLASGRADEAFRELGLAMRSSPRFARDVFAAARNATGGDLDRMIALLGPFDAPTADMFAAFLVETGDFKAAFRFASYGMLDGPGREGLVRIFFDKGYVRYAALVAGGEIGRLDDGGFEHGELTKGEGFGWRLEKVPPTAPVRVSFDETAGVGGSQALRLDFGGALPPSLAFVSQTVAVEAGTYEIAFSYASGVGGDAPTVRVVERTRRALTQIRIMPLPPASDRMTRLRFEVASGPETEALIIQIAGPDCRSPICLANGTLTIDDMTVTRPSP